MTPIQSLEPRRLLSGTLSNDDTFGTNGFTNAPAVIAGYVQVLDLAVAPNGQTVALALGNGREVVRYNLDGSVDNSFGVNGRFILTFDANAVEIQSDGSVLVAGTQNILKLTRNGNTDGDFGVGGLVSLASDGTFITAAEDLRVRSNGTIVLLRSGTTNGITPAAVVTHLRADGSTINSFGGDGSTSFVLPLTLARVANLEALALSGDGGAVYFGGTGLAEVHVARTSDLGILDPNFQITFAGVLNTHLDGIEVTETGDVLTLSDTGLLNSPAQVKQFDDFGNPGTNVNLLPQVTGQTPTAIAQGGGRVLVGFQQPYAIARLLSDQIAPGIFLTGTVLSVDGSSGDDIILINRSDDQLRITRNGKRTLVERSAVSVINLDGRAGNDSLTVTVAVSTVARGSLGDDTITTGDANDTLAGEDGNDSLTANGGNDLLDGGVGADRLIGGSGKDRLAGQGGKDRLYGGSGDDQIDGGAGDDQLYGQSGNDKLFGGRGNDLLDGDGGTNQFFPGEGDDTLLGT